MIAVRLCWVEKCHATVTYIGVFTASEKNTLEIPLFMLNKNIYLNKFV